LADSCIKPQSDATGKSHGKGRIAATSTKKNQKFFFQFRAVPNPSLRDEWSDRLGGSERKVQNGSRYQWQDRASGDLASENYFNYGNGNGRISDYEQGTALPLID
jgi:hypothetical protein